MYSYNNVKIYCEFFPQIRKNPLKHGIFFMESEIKIQKKLP